MVQNLIFITSRLEDAYLHICRRELSPAFLRWDELTLKHLDSALFRLKLCERYAREKDKTIYSEAIRMITQLQEEIKSMQWESFFNPEPDFKKIKETLKQAYRILHELKEEEIANKMRMEMQESQYEEEED